jgi:septum formation protein
VWTAPLSKKSLEYKQFKSQLTILAQPMDIILASTSPYRRVLLERLQLGFRCIPPKVDEEPNSNETPSSLAERLARSKAQAVANLHPDALVIGSDQVASIDGLTIGKPGNFENAKAQLQMSSGREVRFYTGIALVSQARGLERFHVEPFGVRFRVLTDAEIEKYLLREQPYDCAGSLKAEGLGIALFEQLTGNDPTSLEGLPLIKLNEMLAEAGVDVLGS